jgi:hypothetical protein
MIELGRPIDSPINLWCNNVGATYLSCNLVFKGRFY